MTPSNALERIKLDTPLKSVRNTWQYEREIEVLEDYIKRMDKFIKALQALDVFEEMGIEVLLQWANGQKPQTPNT